MASPAIVGSPAETAVGTASTSHVVNLPTGTTGNLLLAVMSKGSAGTTPSVNALTGWNELLDEAQVLGLYIAWKRADGTEGSTTTFTLSSATRGAWVVYEISGESDTIAPQIGTTATGTSVNPNPPSVSVTGGSKDILAFAMFGMAGEQADDDTLVTTFPTNYTQGQAEKTCGTAGTDLGGMIGAAARQVTTSAEDPGTFTAIDNAAWRAQTIVVHPYSFQSVSITEANETDAVQAVTFVKGTISVGPATETDWTNSIVPFQPFPATDTAAAQTLDYELAAGGTHVDISPALETDTALRRALFIVPAAETDTARRLAPVFKWATETDTAQALTYAQASDFDITEANETDTAQTVSYAQASDFDLTHAAETDTAEAVSYAQAGNFDIAHVAETDSAQALTASHTRSLTVATETDLANQIIALAPLPALETDTAQVLSFTQEGLSLTTATETDTAQALTFSQPSAYSITPALETDIVAGTEHVTTYSLTPATETDSPRPLVVTKPIYKTLTLAAETDTAQTLAITHTHDFDIVAATETDAAQAVTYSQAGSYSIAPALETDEARTATVRPHLTPATETDSAQAITYAQAGDFDILPALETDSAQALVVPQTIQITPAVSTSTAQPITNATAVTITAATETDSAQTLTAHKALGIVLVTETDTAPGLAYGGAYDILHASETDTATAFLFGVMPPSGTVQTMPTGRISMTRTGRVHRTKQGAIS